MTPDDLRPHAPSPSAAIVNLEAAFAAQRAAFARDPFPDAATRAARIDSLIACIEKREAAFIEAINADFGGRAQTETVFAEIMMGTAAARAARHRLAAWMRPRRAPTPLHLAPARSEIRPQPLGVVGVIAPWNYPLQLAITPAAAALAAGNRVMIKPSELTPRTSALLAEAAAEAFDPAVLTVTTGGPDIGQAFSGLRFDHLFFTGSTAVGRRVAEAAARNLTPVTLELGGKSPAIIDRSADLPRAARSIVQGKLFNAGQTCIAPDYALAPSDRIDDVVEAMLAAARSLYPAIDTTPDYTSIVSDRHFHRLQSMIEEARAAGARIVSFGSPEAMAPTRKTPFTLVINPPAGTAVTREEIFGPVLPVIGVASPEDAIGFVNNGPRPLALYWFGDDRAALHSVLTRTAAGGVTVNDTLLHFANEHLPFGGVGDSGIGAYHGRAGFDLFSHLKPVLHQSRLSGSSLLHPPYTDKTAFMLRLVRRIL